MRVTKAVTFDAAHRVPGHPKCGNVHGHTWRVEATVEGDVAPSGMVFDFGILGALLKAHVHDRFDHRTILAADDPVALALLNNDMDVELLVGPPTAENLAVAVVDALQHRLPDGVTLRSVRVFETATSWVEAVL